MKLQDSGITIFVLIGVLFLSIPSIFAKTIVLKSGKTIETGVVDCLNKGYMLFIPCKIVSVSPAPVLICLPGIKEGGIGVSAKHDINMWTFPAEKNGFVVINLEMDYNLFKSPADIKNLYERIKEIVSSLSDSYPIDSQRLYIAGTSGGGAMSISLALMFPGKFVAVGVVGGAVLMFGAKANLKGSQENHFYMVHGQKDKNITIEEFYFTKKQLEDNGAAMEFHIFPEGEHILTSGAYKEVVDWLAKVK